MPVERVLLQVNLRVDYPHKPLAVRDVAFSIRAGEVLGLVGESGSGKSTIAMALLRLLRWKGGRATGQITLEGQDLMTLSEREMERLRGSSIGLVLQSPMASLNPALRVERQVGEVWRAHARGSRVDLIEAVQKALVRVGLPCNKEFLRRYPSQISVGQAQRVLIAMAVMHSPSLRVADEPTSALDAMTQVEILKMLTALNREMGTAILYISHDLQSVASICQRIAILHEGTIVECGKTGTLLTQPQHPYTRQLLACAPWLPWWLEQSKGSKGLSLRDVESEPGCPSTTGSGTDLHETKDCLPMADGVIETTFPNTGKTSGIGGRRGGTSASNSCSHRRF